MENRNHNKQQKKRYSKQDDLLVKTKSFHENKNDNGRFLKITLSIIAKTRVKTAQKNCSQGKL